MHSMTLEQQRFIPASVPSGVISRRKLLLTIHVIFLALVSGVGILYSTLQLDGETLLYPACWLVTLSFCWVLSTWYYVRGTLLEPYPLFMLAAGLFHGGQAVLEILGLNTEGILRGHVSADILTPAMYLVAVSLLAVHGGAILTLKTSGSSISQRHNTPERRRATRMAGWLLLGASAIPTFILLSSSLSVVLDYGYLGMYRYQSTMSIAQATSAFFIPGVIFLLAGSKEYRRLQVLSLVLAAAYAVFYLFLGARRTAVMECVAVVWAFDRSVARISRPLVAGLALAALLIFPLVRQSRATNGSDRLSLSEQLEMVHSMENPISSSVAEMGYSLITVTHTLQLVPSSRPFDYGMSYLSAVFAVVPNLGWEVHPSVEHGMLADWLIRTVDPSVAAGGGGLGFSFIAEAYLNFGWIGGPIWLGVIGYSLCWFFSKSDGDDPAKHALVASFLSFFLLYARSESAAVSRGLVWYAILPYLLVTLLTVKRHHTGGVA